MKRIVILCLMAVIGFGVAEASVQKKNVAIKTTVFVTDMDGCPTCAKKIENTIPMQKGVKDMSMDLEKKTITITYDQTKTSDATLTKALQRIKINVKSTAPAAPAKK